MRAVLIIALALLTGMSSAAKAEALIAVGRHSLQSVSWCRAHSTIIYTAQTKEAPARIAKSFAGKGALIVFRTCTDQDDNIHYWVREPRPNRNGVCRTYEHEVFPGTERDEAFITLLYDGTAPNWYFMMKGWKNWPPQDWTSLHYAPKNAVLAFVSDEDCPRGDDPRYVTVKNVTDGTLKVFVDFWKRITASPEQFTRAFAAIPANQRKSIEGLRSAVFERHERIWSIDCEDNGCGAFIGAFEVKFDTSDRGFAINGLTEWEEIGY